MKVVLSKLARYNRAILLRGISDRHSIEIARRVSANIRDCLYKLPQLPRKYPLEDTRKFGEVHRAVVDNLTIILYRINRDTIEVLNITDARANWK